MCNKNAELAALIIKFKYDLKALGVSGRTMPEPIAIKLLRQASRVARSQRQLAPLGK